MKSPCTGCCFYDHNKDRCTACLRTLEEIERWLHLSNTEKKAVLTKCRERGGHPAKERCC